VLLLAYRRPSQTAILLNQLANMDEHYLRIVVDAPRRARDAIGQGSVVELARKHLQTHSGELIVRPENHGLRVGVASSISEFLEDHGEGVILEDDTIPGFDFFPFASAMLERFRDDQRVGMVSGNYHVATPHFPCSYGFSRNKSTWGWATWERAWRGMSVEPTSIQELNLPELVQNMCSLSGSGQLEHWTEVVHRLRTNQVDTWDWYWFIHLARRNQLSVVPAANLVANIGFGSLATHTFGEGRREFEEIGSLNWPLLHPSEMVPNLDYERDFEAAKYHFNKSIKEIRSDDLDSSSRVFKSSIMTKVQELVPKSKLRSYARKKFLQLRG
jgi:hypothetical protein